MRTINLLPTIVFAGLVFTHAVPAAEPGALTTDQIKNFQADYEKRGDQEATINAVTNNNLNSLALNRSRLAGMDHMMSIRLDGSGIVNQRGSGRCWMFAGVNVYSPKIMARLKTPAFEISEPYLTFWDKMEKSNYFLEEIIRTADRKLNDRELQIILESPFGDGGWWNYFADLVNKYGLVPLSAMPESKQSVATGSVNRLATTKLRAFAVELRNMHKEGRSDKELRARKDKMLSEIYRLLIYTYGPPPDKFDFRFKSTDSTISPEMKSYTPQSFREEALGDSLPQFVALINNPARDMNKLYEIEDSRNMMEMPNLTVLNIPVERLEQYCLKSILDSQGVWFACDVGQERYSDSGLLAVGIHDFKSALGMDFSMSKGDRISYGEVTPNHAMVLMGVDTTDQGGVRKWLVENSWGKDKGIDGFWYMYDDWFKQYVLLAMIDKRLLSDEDARKFEEKPVKIPMWDPFFLALRKLH